MSGARNTCLGDRADMQSQGTGNQARSRQGCRQIEGYQGWEGMARSGADRVCNE